MTGDIERRNNTGMATRGLSPTTDSNDYTWTVNSDWVWNEYSDLSIPIKSAFAKKNLLPNNLLLQSFHAPEGPNKKVQGWLAGANGFTFFSINGGSVEGEFREFKTLASVKGKSIPSDIIDLAKLDTQKNPLASEIEKIGDGQLLPENLRNMILSISGKYIYFDSSYKNSYSNSETLTVKVGCAGKTHFLGIVAVQTVTSIAGESEDKLDKRLAKQPWEAKVIYQEI